MRPVAPPPRARKSPAQAASSRVDRGHQGAAAQGHDLGRLAGRCRRRGGGSRRARRPRARGPARRRGRRRRAAGSAGRRSPCPPARRRRRPARRCRGRSAPSGCSSATPCHGVLELLGGGERAHRHRRLRRVAHHHLGRACRSGPPARRRSGPRGPGCGARRCTSGRSSGSSRAPRPCRNRPKVAEPSRHVGAEDGGVQAVGLHVDPGVGGEEVASASAACGRCPPSR